jgi:hypothetical protein
LKQIVSQGFKKNATSELSFFNVRIQCGFELEAS